MGSKSVAAWNPLATKLSIFSLYRRPGYAMRELLALRWAAILILGPGIVEGAPINLLRMPRQMSMDGGRKINHRCVGHSHLLVLWNAVDGPNLQAPAPFKTMKQRVLDRLIQSKPIGLAAAIRKRSLGAAIRSQSRGL